MQLIATELNGFQTPQDLANILVKNIRGCVALLRCASLARSVDVLLLNQSSREVTFRVLMRSAATDGTTWVIG